MNDLVGTWHCQLVSQEQSPAELARNGPHPDADGPGLKPTNAAKTDFAGATIELRADGGYTLSAPDKHNCSHGRWKVRENTVEVAQAPDCVNGHEGVSYLRVVGEQLRFAFRLVPDAHDGLDTLVLSFGRTPATTAPPSGDFVERVLAAKDEAEIFELLDAEPAAAMKARANDLWDAWLAGRLPGPEEHPNHRGREAAFLNSRIDEAAGFTFRHARHALSLDPQSLGPLGYEIQKALVKLPSDSSEAELATVVTEPWLRYLAAYRFLGGSTVASLYTRPMLPQPAANDIAREVLHQQPTFSSLDGVPDLFPEGNRDLAKVIWRYRGHQMLKKPLALIEARGLEHDVLEATTEYLADATHRDPKLTPKNMVASSVLLSALMWNVFLSCRLGVPLSKESVSGLRVKVKYSSGVPTDEEKSLLRGLTLPEKTAKLFHERFFL